MDAGQLMTGKIKDKWPCFSKALHCKYIAVVRSRSSIEIELVMSTALNVRDHIFLENEHTRSCTYYYYIVHTHSDTKVWKYCMHAYPRTRMNNIFCIALGRNIHKFVITLSH